MKPIGAGRRPTMISFDEARQIIQAVEARTATETPPLHLVLDRALAENTGPLAAGVTLQPLAISQLAANGIIKPKVYAPAIIGVVVTRDRLPTERDEDDEAADPNAVALIAAIQQSGAIPLDMGLVPQDPELQSAAIVRALDTAHVVCVTGLTRDEEYARLKEALVRLQGEPVFDGVEYEAAKQMALVRFAAGYLFTLPADVEKMLVCFDRFVRPLARRLAGHAGP